VDPSTGAVVALKTLAEAKSRLDALPGALRRRLAWTMALDTLTALTAVVDEVVVVGDEPALASRLSRAGLAVRVAGEPMAAGLNGALEHGAGLLRSDGHSRVLACVGDLPALHPSSIQRVLGAALTPGRCYLADASGTGTTMLIACEVPLAPRFQGPSASAHRGSGAEPLTDERLGSEVPDARQDVDTAADLAAAVELGVGAATAALLDPRSGRLADYALLTTTGYTDSEDRPVVLAGSGHRLVLPAAAVADGLRDLRPGQRLHGVHVAGVVRSAWL